MIYKSTMFRSNLWLLYSNFFIFNFNFFNFTRLNYLNCLMNSSKILKQTWLTINFVNLNYKKNNFFFKPVITVNNQKFFYIFTNDLKILNLSFSSKVNYFYKNNYNNLISLFIQFNLFSFLKSLNNDFFLTLNLIFSIFNFKFNLLSVFNFLLNNVNMLKWFFYFKTKNKQHLKLTYNLRFNPSNSLIQFNWRLI